MNPDANIINEEDEGNEEAETNGDEDNEEAETNGDEENEENDHAEEEPKDKTEKELEQDLKNSKNNKDAIEAEN